MWQEMPFLFVYVFCLLVDTKGFTSTVCAYNNLLVISENQTLKNTRMFIVCFLEAAPGVWM